MDSYMYIVLILVYNIIIQEIVHGLRVFKLLFCCCIEYFPLITIGGNFNCLFVLLHSFTNCVKFAVNKDNVFSIDI